MKRIVSLFLICVLVLSCFVGCTKQENPTEPPTTETKPVETPGVTEPAEKDPDVTPTYPIIEASKGLGFNNFETAWFNYINQTKSTENYMVSPLSLKMAMALAAAGANTDTLDEILVAFEYATLDDYLNWGKVLLAHEDEVNTEIEEYKQAPWIDDNYDAGYSIANSIWHNTDKPGEFLDLYKEYMGELDAMFNELPGPELKDAINTWVDEKTHGLIPQLFNDDLSDYSNILVNTLYMKSNWIYTFNEYATAEGDFTTITGEVVKKDMMKLEETFKYYKDDNSELVILPMEHGFKMAIVLGSNENILEKINAAEYELVNVKMPKFEIETTLDDIVPFMESMGVKLAFDKENADFTNMTTINNYIDKIIQKTKIKLDENGVEAAAVTAIVMDATSALPMDPPKPIYFEADEAFTFYIFTDVAEDATELLFYGQYVQ